MTNFNFWDDRRKLAFCCEYLRICWANLQQIFMFGRQVTPEMTGLICVLLYLQTASKGGATNLKVGGTICERSEQKNFFCTPHFLYSGGYSGL